MKWTGEQEERLILLRDYHGESYRDIAGMLGTTVQSVKHKYEQLKQTANQKPYPHTKEKTGDK